VSAGVNSCAVVTVVAAIAIAIAAPKRLCAVQCSAVRAAAPKSSEWAVLMDTFDYG
jgi:hypothetical protein